jgi:DNA modification methylase
MRCFLKGDTLTLLQSQIPSNSINLIYFDPPFGTTQNPWDEKQDWPSLFRECFRVLKEDGMLIIHCSIPFNYELIRSAPKAPSHSWYWTKDSHTNPLISKIQPLRNTEEILVWKNKRSVYYPQKIGNEPQKSTYMTKADYFGQDRKGQTTIHYGKYRTHHITMRRDIQGYSTRPRELVDLIIKSYSKEGDTVLDLFCYKGLSADCCDGRRWIGMDKHFLPTGLF